MYTTVSDAPEQRMAKRVSHDYAEIMRLADASAEESGAAVKVPGVSNVTVFRSALKKRSGEKKYQVYTVKGACYVKRTR